MFHEVFASVCASHFIHSQFLHLGIQLVILLHLTKVQHKRTLYQALLNFQWYREPFIFVLFLPAGDPLLVCESMFLSEGAGDRWKFLLGVEIGGQGQSPLKSLQVCPWIVTKPLFKYQNTSYLR